MENLNQKQERFGARLAECRRNKNFTQEELANRLGVTPQALSKWEKGLSSPDVGMVCTICELLDVSADFLLETRIWKIGEDGNSNIQDEIWNILRGGLEPLKLVIGKDVVSVFLDNHFVELVNDLRVWLSQEGVLLPIVRIMDQQEIKEKEFFILAYDNVLFHEELEEINETVLEHIFEKLGQTVREHYAEILNADIIKSLVDNLRIKFPALLDGIVPEKISYGLLLDICKGFLERGNSLIYLPKIIEAMEERLREQKESTTKELLEAVCAKIERQDNFWVVLRNRK